MLKYLATTLIFSYVIIALLQDSMIALAILICLASQLVHGKVITINNASSNTSRDCCTEEGCLCGSLATALKFINNNTVINITSPTITLNESIRLQRPYGQPPITNIAITGNNVTIIMCNNINGSLYCESCDDVLIEGITWDKCGNVFYETGGVYFDSVSNISLINCTFQHSLVKAVTIMGNSGNVTIVHCSFLSNKKCHRNAVPACSGEGLDIQFANLNIVISHSYFYDNGGSVINFQGNSLPDFSIWNIVISKTNISYNMGVIAFDLSANSSIQLLEVTFSNNNASDEGIRFSLIGKSTMLVSNSLFNANINLGCTFVLYADRAYETEVLFNNSRFTNNLQQNENVYTRYAGVKVTTFTVGLVYLTISSPAYSYEDTIMIITLLDVEISHSVTAASTTGDGGILFIHFVDSNTKYYAIVNLTRVSLISNEYLGDKEGAIYLWFGGNLYINSDVTLQECDFSNNTSYGRGAAICIDNDSIYHGVPITILNSKFHHNFAYDSIIYMNSKNTSLGLISSNFTDNVASCVHLLQSHLFCESVVFANNIADNGAALFIDQGSSVAIGYGGSYQFINNQAIEHGGAIYLNLGYDCPSITIYYLYGIMEVSFINNTAGISGNSLYIYIPTHCKVEKNFSHSDSILNVPCQFNYSQPVNGKMMNIPCDLHYTLLNGTGAPIVTTPHELRLYFPFNDDYNISSTSDLNIYFIRNNILGRPLKFSGAAFDYFGKPAEPIQFNVKCINCYLSSITLPRIQLLVDNITSLSITFSGANVENRLNVSVSLTSVIHSIKEINTTLVVELLPCIDHLGYAYSTTNQTCICYNHNIINCYDNYNEIKRGHWFGSVMQKTTTSLCPNRYCKFSNRTKTREGYYELPNSVDAQCNDHRVGRACGECGIGYALSYDSTDCISVQQCHIAWIALVIMLTCLYWVVVITGVFALMYFKHHMSLGYLYGIIYYYSMVGFLLDNNSYISDHAFYFISILSSFAQLTPGFLGKFCIIKGLSGIDQLFIHYSHPIAVSMLLLLIVVAARHSARITLFVSRCIIPVICLLILLSYTSLVSTSLQLLQPLKFTNPDIKETFTYWSPNIQYFHKQHTVYSVVAIICELFVGIGLPSLLFLEPFLNRKINVIRIKPLLDRFQECYKDRYRCFAAYYLICRQVIFLIAYHFNSDIDYYNLLFYLQTTFIVIAIIHIWIQPYQSELLNALDGVILLLMVLVVNINTFAFLKDVTVEVIAVVLVMFPLILFSMILIKEAIYAYAANHVHHRHYNLVNNADNNVQGVAVEEDVMR